MTQMTKAQSDNLQIIKDHGGAVYFGKSWPAGLNQRAIRSLVKSGVLVADSKGYRVA